MEVMSKTRRTSGLILVTQYSTSMYFMILKTLSTCTAIISYETCDDRMDERSVAPIQSLNPIAQLHDSIICMCKVNVIASLKMHDTI